MNTVFSFFLSTPCVFQWDFAKWTINFIFYFHVRMFRLKSVCDLCRAFFSLMIFVGFPRTIFISVVFFFGCKIGNLSTTRTMADHNGNRLWQRPLNSICFSVVFFYTVNSIINHRTTKEQHGNHTTDHNYDHLINFMHECEKECARSELLWNKLYMIICVCLRLRCAFN